ncbi:MAG: hypothetical protein RLY16_1602 [Bacteroidota bacterium]
MKKICLILIMLSYLTADATNYYLSSSGSDGASGTSPATAWKTISKLNASFSLLVAGDSVLFRRGDQFYGSIYIAKSGTSTNPIIFSAYGTGNRPVISGLTDVTSWTNTGTNLWTSAAITGVQNTLSIVTINNVAVPMGRFPNYNSSTGGYQKFESSSGTNTIIDNELTASPSWTGAEIVLKPNPWTIGTFPITAHTGTNLVFSGNSTVIRNNYGYFFQNSLQTLDLQNEWYYNKTTKQLTVYSTSTPTSVKIATRDTLVTISGRSFLKFVGLEFQGADKEGLSLNSTDGIHVEDCSFLNIGFNAIRAKASTNAVLQNNRISDIYNAAIELDDINNANFTIKNNIIHCIGSVPGKGVVQTAITTTGNGHLIQGNAIDSVGYVGIQFYRGSNITIKNNTINTYCFVKSDGGGIYTWNNFLTPTTYTNNKVIGNIVLNGVGVTHGTASTVPDVDGIYMDDNTGNVDITDNTVANIAGSGIYIHNNFNIKVERNTVFNCTGQQLSFNHNLAYINGVLSPYTTPIRNVTVKNNIFFSKAPTQLVFGFTSIRNDIDSTGIADSNYYTRPVFEDKIINIVRNVSGTNVTTDHTLGSWKSTYTRDAQSKSSAKAIAPYTVSGLVGANRYTNSQFTSNITGMQVYSANGNHVVAWDNTSKITGVGSLRVSFPTINSSTYTSIYTNGGAVDNTKSYILRFSTLGTTDSASLRVYLRKTASPYTTLTPLQTKNIGKSRVNHEFLFQAPTTEAAASVMIEVKQNSGTTYIDNLEFYEATIVPTNLDDEIRFVYNATAAPVTIPLGARYITVDSTIHNGEVTLNAYSSKILMKAGVTDSTVDAWAGADIILPVTVDSAILNGVGTGNIVSYTWSKVSGPAQFKIINPGSKTTIIDSLVPGDYTFKLRVVNNLGLADEDSVHVILASIVPVKLISFTANAVKNTTYLNWVTSSEINNSHYEIERSADGFRFQQLGRVNATLQVSSDNRYSFTDPQSLNGINYYRLVFVDKNGTRDYSKVITVNNKANVSFAINQIIVNPNTQAIQFGVSVNDKQSLKMRVVDASGKTISNAEFNTEKGINQITKNLQHLSNGIYYLSISNETEMLTKSFMVQQ